MTEPDEKIVLYESFDNVIKANIIKTKLDAYGIPCFLTGEHFVNLYPLKNDLFPGVRLYIFEKDLEKVQEVLVQEPVSESDAIRCPQCGSSNVLLEDSHKGKYWRLVVALLMIVIPAKRVYRCQDCEHEFKL